MLHSPSPTTPIMGATTTIQSTTSVVKNKSSVLDRFPEPVQFVILASGVFLFFGIHNYLQEAIMTLEGFRYGVMLGYMEVFGVTMCSFLERTVRRETPSGRAAPLSSYPLLTACLLASSSLSNWALNFINFPTKVVFRSCKLIPTMIVASIVHSRRFTSVEYGLAICISVGLVLFAAADWELTPTFHPIGLVLVSLSVCADAILPNAQEGLFRVYGSSRLEVTFYTNIFTLMAMTIMTTVLSNDLVDFAQFCFVDGGEDNACPKYALIYTFIAYLAISFHMTVVQRFGGVAAVLVATGRKGMTLIVSFMLFPKAFSWFYVVGAVLVLGGLLSSSLFKLLVLKKQNKAKLPNSSTTEQEPLFNKTPPRNKDKNDPTTHYSASTRHASPPNASLNTNDPGVSSDPKDNVNTNGSRVTTNGGFPADVEQGRTKNDGESAEEEATPSSFLSNLFGLSRHKHQA